MSNLYLFIACVSALLSGVFWMCFAVVISVEEEGKSGAYILMLGGFLSSALSVAMAYLAGGV